MIAIRVARLAIVRHEVDFGGLVHDLLALAHSLAQPCTSGPDDLDRVGSDIHSATFVAPSEDAFRAAGIEAQLGPARGSCARLQAGCPPLRPKTAGYEPPDDVGARARYSEPAAFSR